MAASRGHGLRPGGVVRALGRLILLIGFGFGAGLLIGVLSEEPELLAGHLRGEGETILLTPAEGNGSSGVPSSVAGKVVRVASEREEGVVPRSAESSDLRLPAVGTASSGRVADSTDSRSWAIQVGAFSDEASATQLAEDLDAKGYDAKLLAADGNATRWRVRVQPVRDEAKAKEIADRLKRIERLPTWVLPMEARSR